MDCGHIVAIEAKVTEECKDGVTTFAFVTYNPSNQLYIWSAYLSALSLGIAPLMTA